MEENEIKVFSQSHGDKGDCCMGDNSRDKSGFSHFVEESTLRNVSLDELEDLSEAACIAGSGGNAGRTPSTVSSDQAHQRLVVIVEWNGGYVNKPEGMLRLALLACSIISLGCVASAGTNEIDVLELPFVSSIRAHIFVAVFSILISTAFFILGITAVIESFPVYWNVIDAALHGSLSTLYIFSSAMLLRAEHESRHNLFTIGEWTKVQMSLSAVFGFLCTLICVFLTIIRSCGSKTPTVPEDIVLTSLKSS